MIWTACEEDMVSISADMVKAQKMWFRLKCSSVFQRISPNVVPVRGFGSGPQQMVSHEALGKQLMVRQVAVHRILPRCRLGRA